MILLLHLDYSGERKVTAFRLMVKRRLYLFNKDGMADVSPAERKEGLQKTYDGLVADYRRLTEKFDE
jgi:histone acetyltransferase 1